MGFGGGASRSNKYMSLRKEGLKIAWGKGANRQEETGRMFSGIIQGAALRFNEQRGDIPAHFSFQLDMLNDTADEFNYKFEIRESDPAAMSFVNQLANLGLSKGDNIAIVAYEATNGRLALSVKNEVGGPRTNWAYALNDEAMPDCPLTGELTRSGAEARDYRPRQIFMRGVFIREVAMPLGMRAPKNDEAGVASYIERVAKLTKSAKTGNKVAVLFESNALGFLEQFVTRADQQACYDAWNSRYKELKGKGDLDEMFFYEEFEESATSFMDEAPQDEPQEDETPEVKFD